MGCLACWISVPSACFARRSLAGLNPASLLLRIPSGLLEVKLALEIAAQVAAGLAAVHKQKLVHRDLKPSNIMVSWKTRGTVTAEIINLGLAKAVHEFGSQPTISTLGAFVGTPEFAS